MTPRTKPTPTTIPPNGSNTPAPHQSPLTVLASSRAIIAGQLTPATIVISPETGKILSVFDTVVPPSNFPAWTAFTDYSPRILLPGLVDAHVHLNEPGRTEWEGFWTGTRAAARGGVTTVVDMPLNAIPPTTSVAGFREKIAAAEGKCWVDVGFYGGVVPGNAGELKPLVEMGVRGFKGFMIDSGVPEFPAVSSEDIARAMTELADSPTVLMFHAEMMAPIAASGGNDVHVSLPPNEPSGSPTSYRTFLDSRPPSLETYAIEEIIRLAPLAPNLPLHIVHVSAVEAISILREARRQGIKITAETCFHYLCLAAESIGDGDTRHKCCPPIRSAANQDGLWTDLMHKSKSPRAQDHEPSVIKTVVSDHSPCTPQLKLLPPHLAHSEPGKPAPASSQKTQQSGKGDFLAAWGGISSLGLGLPLLWTEGLQRYSDPEPLIRAIVEWCCVSTALQVGLEHSKGELRVGFDADVAVFDPDEEWVVGGEEMLWRNKVSPWEGKKVRGRVRETWLRGSRVWSLEEGFGRDAKPGGRLILEERRM